MWWIYHLNKLLPIPTPFPLLFSFLFLSLSAFHLMCPIGKLNLHLQSSHRISNWKRSAAPHSPKWKVTDCSLFVCAMMMSTLSSVNHFISMASNFPSLSLSLSWPRVFMKTLLSMEPSGLLAAHHSVHQHGRERDLEKRKRRRRRRKNSNYLLTWIICSPLLSSHREWPLWEGKR